jgi:ribulose-5-phosphate 4-epimerase/fuculose-1-phosphate aldolase
MNAPHWQGLDAAFKVRDSHEVRSCVSPQEWQTRVDLAACYRLAARYGWTDLIYTHISARVPGPDEHYLLNPFGFMFDEVCASNLVKVDLDGRIIGDSPHFIHRAGFVIHSAIHAARADAHCVFHSHTRAGMAVSIGKSGLLPLTQHAMLFHGRVAYHDSEGFALELEERKRLAADLGDKAVMILRNHGTLVVGSSIGEAFSMMWHLEKALQAQVDALAGGQAPNLPPPGVAQAIAKRAFTGESLASYRPGDSPLGRLEWPALLRMLDRTEPSYQD